MQHYHAYFFTMITNTSIRYEQKFLSSMALASENIRFSSLFADGDVSRGGKSATQRQKFHTDDVK